MTRAPIASILPIVCYLDFPSYLACVFVVSRVRPPWPVGSRELTTHLTARAEKRAAQSSDSSAKRLDLVVP